MIAPAAVGGGRRGALSFSAIRAQRRAAEAVGAAGLLIVRPAPAEDAGTGEPPKPFREALSWANRSFDRKSILLGHGGTEGDDASEGSSPRIPVLYLETAANEFLVDSGFRSGGERGALDALTAAFTYSAIEEKIWSQNVVAMVPASDEERSAECVVFSAHYDHVGVGAKGEVFNGADDNASGTSALLEVAEAMAESPPAPRSVVFLWVSAEEKGLLGSEWWVDHPTLPAGSTIVANVNMDMVGRNEPGKVSVCPSPKHDGFSTIGPLVAASCVLESFTPVYDADRYYRRTDSYNFAEKGIPSVFLFTGEHDDYHRQTDTIEKINFAKATSIARIAYHVGYALARAEETPSMTGPTPSEEDESKDAASDKNRDDG
ncbi:MAG: M28 family peptidase [Planctomycetota bacterium]